MVTTVTDKMHVITGIKLKLINTLIKTVSFELNIR
jgi:hypothetical protein